MVKVKICGLMTPKDITIVNATHPDYAGFVFAGGRHQISLKQARTLRKQLDPAIVSVGVFVNAPLDTMLAAVTQHIISIVQLHGNEPEAVVEMLQERGAKVIRVFKGDRDYLPATSADYVMVDAGAGSGQKLNWQRIKHPNQPLFLAGGLTPENVTQAVNIVHPFAVDVSSGVEGNHGKDRKRVASFIASVRN